LAFLTKSGFQCRSPLYSLNKESLISVPSQQQCPDDWTPLFYFYGGRRQKSTRVGANLCLLGKCVAQQQGPAPVRSKATVIRVILMNKRSDLIGFNSQGDSCNDKDKIGPTFA
jgi:hypothetical protein